MTTQRSTGRTLRATLIAAVCAGALAAVPAGVAAPGKQAPLRLETLKVVDPVGGNVEAFRMLVPAGWIWRGGVVWNLRYANLASVAMRVRNPRAPEAVESYQLIPQVWHQSGIFGFPPGSVYLGMEVRAPLSAATTIESLIVPAFRGRLGPRVVRRTALPRVARAYAAGGNTAATSTTYDAARVRIAYTEAGRPIEEDFYAVTSYTRSPFLPGAIQWGPQLLYSFKAPRGQLDRKARLYQAMIASVRPSLKWYAGYLQVVDMWVQGQMRAIRAAGQLSKTIAAASDAISRSTREAYENQQQTYDRVYDSVSEQIRGVETYRNPFEGVTVQLPSDYGNAWVSARGEYLLSDQSGFDPNVGSTIEWRRLRASP